MVMILVCVWGGGGESGGLAVLAHYWYQVIAVEPIGVYALKWLFIQRWKLNNRQTQGSLDCTCYSDQQPSILPGLLESMFHCLRISLKIFMRFWAFSLAGHSRPPLMTLML